MLIYRKNFHKFIWIIFPFLIGVWLTNMGLLASLGLRCPWKFRKSRLDIKLSGSGVSKRTSKFSAVSHAHYPAHGKQRQEHCLEFEGYIVVFRAAQVTVWDLVSKRQSESDLNPGYYFVSSWVKAVRQSCRPSRACGQASSQGTSDPCLKVSALESSVDSYFQFV